MSFGVGLSWRPTFLFVILLALGAVGLMMRELIVRRQFLVMLGLQTSFSIGIALVILLLPFNADAWPSILADAAEALLLL